MRYTGCRSDVSISIDCSRGPEAVGSVFRSNLRLRRSPSETSADRNLIGASRSLTESFVSTLRRVSRRPSMRSSKADCVAAAGCVVAAVCMVANMV